MEEKTKERLQERESTTPLYSFNGILLNREKYFEAHQKYRKRIFEERLRSVMVVHSKVS